MKISKKFKKKIFSKRNMFIFVFVFITLVILAHTIGIKERVQCASNELCILCPSRETNPFLWGGSELPCGNWLYNFIPTTYRLGLSGIITAIVAFGLDTIFVKKK